MDWNDKQAVGEYMRQWRAASRASISKYLAETREHRRTYNREYERNRKAKRRQNWLSEHGPCVECGSWNDLEIDHIDPSEKSFKISWSSSWEKLLPELAKCQVLCHDCHLEKTSQWRKEQTHCKSGHLFDKVNSRGQRICSICINASSRKYYQKKKLEN